MAETPLDVGFADFVAVLLVETLDSIVASHTSQAERLRSLDAAAELSVAEFASTGIGEEVLAAMLVQLFPDGQGGTTIVAGGPEPDPDALAELDLRLEGGEHRNGTLTSTGVTAVQQAVRLYLAGRQLEAVREVRRQGVPRVLVDGGTLRAKLNFTAVRNEPDETDDPAPTRAPLGAGATALAAGTLRSNLVAFDSPIRAGVLDSIRHVRLKVAAPTKSDPEEGEPTQTTTSQVFGEVEIRFRTEI